MIRIDSRSSAITFAHDAVARRDVRAVLDACIWCAVFARGHEERCVAAARRYLARLLRAAGQSPKSYFELDRAADREVAKIEGSRVYVDGVYAGELVGFEPAGVIFTNEPPIGEEIGRGFVAFLAWLLTIAGEVKR